MLDPVYVGDPLPAALNEEREAINALDEAVSERISKPAGAATGDGLLFDGSDWVSTITRLFEGAGPPNGTVAAPVGSRYVDTLGTRGAVEWVKQSGGAGNTGWLCLTGNTGRRNVAGLVDIGNGTVHVALITRVGSVCDLFLDFTMPSNKTSTWTAISALPGFGPGYYRIGAMHAYSGATPVKGNVEADGGIIFSSVTGAVRERYTATWLTQDEWPAALPGVAA